MAGLLLTLFPQWAGTHDVRLGVRQRSGPMAGLGPAVSTPCAGHRPAGNTRTSQTSCCGTLRSTACVTRSATAQTSGAAVGATGLQARATAARRGVWPLASARSQAETPSLRTARTPMAPPAMRATPGRRTAVARAATAAPGQRTAVATGQAATATLGPSARARPMACAQAGIANPRPPAALPTAGAGLTANAAAGAMRLAAVILAGSPPAPDARRQRGRCSRPVMTRADPSRLTQPRAEAEPAAPARRGTARRPVGPQARDRCAATRRFRVSRRRCTRLVSLPPGTAVLAGSPRPALRRACQPAASQAGLSQARTPARLRPAASGQARAGRAPAKARPRVPTAEPAVGRSRSRPGRRRRQLVVAPHRGTTTRTLPPMPSPATRCWRSAIRPRT